jgi:hypothetical protein
MKNEPLGVDRTEATLTRNRLERLMADDLVARNSHKFKDITGNFGRIDRPVRHA